MSLLTTTLQRQNFPHYIKFSIWISVGTVNLIQCVPIHTYYESCKDLINLVPFKQSRYTKSEADRGGNAQLGANYY